MKSTMRFACGSHRIKSRSMNLYSSPAGSTGSARTDRYRDVVGVTNDPYVSSDIIRDPRAAVIDLGLTQVTDGDLVKVMSWYDNEWGYSSQMVREARRIASAFVAS